MSPLSGFRICKASFGRPFNGPFHFIFGQLRGTQQKGVTGPTHDKKRLYVKQGLNSGLVSVAMFYGGILRM